MTVPCTGDGHVYADTDTGFLWLMAIPKVGFKQMLTLIYIGSKIYRIYIIPVM